MSASHLFFLCASALSVRQECETKSRLCSRDGWVGVTAGFFQRITPVCRHLSQSLRPLSLESSRAVKLLCKVLFVFASL